MGRKSRPLVHAGASGMTFWSSRPASALRLYNAGLIITLAHNLKAIRSAAFRLLPLLVISLRRCNNNCGRSEERRVGKEKRAMGETEHEQNNDEEGSQSA